MRKLKDYLMIGVKGACMGAADVIPGVSGGTIAFITGIYDEFVGSIARIDAEAVKLLFKGTSTAFVGDFANFAVGCSLVLPATIIYHVHKSKHSAIVGLVVGSLCMSVFGSAFNAIYLLPKFAQLYGIPLDVIIGMGTKINANIKDVTTFVMICVAPLNLLKSGFVSVLTLLLYKRVARPLFGKTK